MRQILVKRISLIFLCFFSMFLFTACEYNFENISNEKNEKIHEDIPADNIRNINISGNARSIIIKQGVTDNFEFYNADLDENNQYEVEVTYDEEGNDLNILVTMDNAEASNDVLGSVVLSIPKNEFEKIEITGEFNQVYLCTLNSDVFVRTNSARVVMDLLADQLNHNITLVGSETNAFRGVSVYLDKFPDNVKIEFPNIPQSAINAPFELLKGDKLELGSGTPIISINNADKLDFYVEMPSDETPNVETPSEEDNKIEISMEDVISIGKDEAVKYYDDLQLTNVYSYDNDYDRNVMSGDDGKREWWYVNFANEKNNYVSIMIIDGEVANVEHYDQNGNNRLIDMDDVNMTADEAVQKAKDYGLVGGDPDNESHWVSGYNFKLSYASLVSSPNDYRIFLEVIGISPNGNFAHIDFDATTGELILAEEEIEYSNGDVEWKSFN